MQDRLYEHACWEARLVVIVWALALTWTVGYCYLRGYEHPRESWVVQHGWATEPAGAELKQIAGLPDWVFFGIVAPWLASTAFTVIFCLFIMKDDDLGIEAGEGETHGD